MNLLRPLFFILFSLTLIACDLYNTSYDKQGNVRDLGDAMDHCRGFMKSVLGSDTYIHIDSASSRETSEHYVVFLDLQDDEQEGFAKCRVNKLGLIDFYSNREFRQQPRFFLNK